MIPHRDHAHPEPSGAQWVRHRAYYVAVDETPGLPSTLVEEEELRRGRWGWLRAAPSLLLALLIRGYRRIISPLYGQVCSFYPSCSAYGLEAVTTHGVIRGVPLTIWRVLRCNPFTGGGVDAVPATSRIWPQGAVPTIIETNHPPIPRDDDD
ncbi:membrane protein insertion efficiency factor YidD [Nesterenkonia lutea]|uniref:Putative membrane protein insertion efficiency factor n=1 Tax=Nesterenkonia lutea TaxID=272919 RepID=A0ABR9JH04_9MICC|nr:membrane protein insertion efficiency factor YidD [Nesterenkonia lutea]MBE1525215.1 putative membrane protein insertion efficiency factor [Nesterenkonia lutea]